MNATTSKSAQGGKKRLQKDSSSVTVSGMSNSTTISTAAKAIPSSPSSARGSAAGIASSAPVTAAAPMNFSSAASKKSSSSSTSTLKKQQQQPPVLLPPASPSPSTLNSSLPLNIKVNATANTNDNSISLLESSSAAEQLLMMESSSAPNDSSLLQGGRKKQLYKTEMCKSMEETGLCPYGPKCQFAHSKGELRVLDRHPRYKTELCKTFWERSVCPYGRRCCFIHTAKAGTGMTFEEMQAYLNAGGQVPSSNHQLNSTQIGENYFPSSLPSSSSGMLSTPPSIITNFEDKKVNSKRTKSTASPITFATVTLNSPRARTISQGFDGILDKQHEAENPSSASTSQDGSPTYETSPKNSTNTPPKLIKKPFISSPFAKITSSANNITTPPPSSSLVFQKLEIETGSRENKDTGAGGEHNFQSQPAHYHHFPQSAPATSAASLFGDHSHNHSRFPSTDSLRDLFNLEEEGSLPVPLMNGTPPPTSAANVWEDTKWRTPGASSSSLKRDSPLMGGLPKSLTSRGSVSGLGSTFGKLAVSTTFRSESVPTLPASATLLHQGSHPSPFPHQSTSYSAFPTDQSHSFFSSPTVEHNLPFPSSSQQQGQSYHSLSAFPLDSSSSYTSNAGFFPESFGSSLKRHQNGQSTVFPAESSYAARRESLKGSSSSLIIGSPLDDLAFGGEPSSPSFRSMNRTSMSSRSRGGGGAAVGFRDVWATSPVILNNSSSMPSSSGLPPPGMGMGKPPALPLDRSLLNSIVSPPSSPITLPNALRKELKK